MAARRETSSSAIKGYLSRMRELTRSVAKRNEKIHSANGERPEKSHGDDALVGGSPKQ